MYLFGWYLGRFITACKTVVLFTQPIDLVVNWKQNIWGIVAKKCSNRPWLIWYGVNLGS